jgi:hypothetical protein
MIQEDTYLAKAKKGARLLAFVPFIRGVALNGSFVRQTPGPGSDIDYLIFGKAGRLFTVRFISLALLQLAGLRRHGQTVAGRICTNCFLSAEHPDLTPRNPVNLKSNLAIAYRYTIPLMASPRLMETFFTTNPWLKDFPIPGEERYSLLIQQTGGPSLPRHFLESLLEGRLGDYIEKVLGAYQTRKILAHVGPEDELVATSSEIRLWPKDPRKPWKTLESLKP